ncbi:hypothetical protein N658DRAFT_523031 [Parathielavia hyrcaniae]|uniref:SRR1-like domain-containing protein n=1 Tax=Parathielavia hyrcaniae TaxID=113614 RepID=A0AAN6Q819_9PEZI|nr:hypothetical protein N658DRAFT_523031 [Parathielavia hyrcaniae]
MQPRGPKAADLRAPYESDCPSVQRTFGTAPDCNLSETEREQARDEAIRRLQELYEQGVPFFSKHVFRHALEQIEDCRNGAATWPTSPDGAEARIISIPTVDGGVTNYKVEMGSVDSGEPYLEYKTFESLTRYANRNFFDPDLAYASTQLLYPLMVRDIVTGQFLPLPGFASEAEVRDNFTAGIQSWEESEDGKRLRSQLSERSDSLLKVTKIVAFACCTMAGRNGVARQHVTHQHTLILTLRDILSSSSRRCSSSSSNDQQQKQGQQQPEIKCFAQDPNYTEADQAVLQEAGIAVLGDPRGFLEVDDETVVLSFSPNIPVRQIITDIARPAILLWNHVQSEAEEAEFWKQRGHQHGPKPMM